MTAPAVLWKQMGNEQNGHMSIPIITPHGNEKTKQIYLHLLWILLITYLSVKYDDFVSCNTLLSLSPSLCSLFGDLVTAIHLSLYFEFHPFFSVSFHSYLVNRVHHCLATFPHAPVSPVLPGYFYCIVVGAVIFSFVTISKSPLCFLYSLILEIGNQ